MQNERVTVVDAVSSHSTVRSIGASILTVSGGCGLIIVGIGIWRVWAYVPIVGFVALGTTILVLVCAAANALIYTAHNLARETYYDIGEFGTRVKGLISRPTLLAPMAQTTATNAAKIAKTDVAMQIPSLFDLLDIGEIYYGMTDMILGYKEGGQMVRGPWPNTFAIAGKGRSGKTRRVVFMLVQALMANAHITICDPHATKPDSLTSELEALAPWLHFARSIPEIMEASQEYLSEMQRRENTVVEQGFRHPPRLIVYDEWSKLMTRIEPEDSEKIIEVVTAASQEYAGYGGYACIIGQSWIADECGGTKIRRALHAVFCHRIDTDYAKFLIKSAKWYKQTEQLATGHSFYQDLDGKVTKLIMPKVEDRAGVKVAEMLLQIAPVATPKQIEGASPSSQRDDFELEMENTGGSMPVEAVNNRNTVINASNALPHQEVSVTDEHFVAVLREIGKKLRAGDTPNDIRKGLGITGGRAMQEVNAALSFLQETNE
jgi:hypothetical protein